MKKLIVIVAFFCNYFVSAQAVMESTYVDVPLNKVQRFIELHKKVTDLSQGEGRTVQGHWVYRHWYGSGAAIVIYDQYNSAQDAINDDFKAVYAKNYEALSAEDKKEMDAVFTEWWSFYNGHWDEMRVIDYEKDFVSKENVDWDIPFIFVVGTYNTKGKPSEMAEAYMDWQTRPLVAEGLQMGGGVTKHYKGAGADLEFFGAFKTMVDFATSISTQGTVNTTARNSFWSLVDGSHADQIYSHVGHLVDGTFDLAGKDK